MDGPVGTICAACLSDGPAPLVGSSYLRSVSKDGKVLLVWIGESARPGRVLCVQEKASVVDFL